MTSGSFVHLWVPEPVLPPVLVHLSWHLCSARLEHLHYMFLGVEVYCLGMILGCRHMHHPNVPGMHNAWQQ